MQRAAVGPAVNRYNMISEMCSDVLEITFCQTPCMHPAPSWGKVCFHWSARGESRSECSHSPHTDPGFLWDTWKTWAISLPAQITLLVSNYCTWGLRINYFHTRVNLFTLSLQEGAFRTFSKNCSLTFTASLVTPKHSKDRHSHAFSIHSNHDYLGQWWIHHFITWLLPDCGNIRQSLK